jgi:hypothetical protein
MTSTLLLAVGFPVLSSAAPAAFAAVSTTACPFHLGALTSNGAAGTLYFQVPLIADNPAVHCVAQVTTTVSITPTEAGVTAYNDIDDNPLTATTNEAFAPGEPDPLDIVGWAAFHCADPAVPGVIDFTVNGLTVSAPVQPTSCFTMGPSILRGLVFDRVVGVAPTADDQGYTTADEFANTTVRGDAVHLAPVVPNDLVSAVASPTTGHGAWLATTDGGVFALGGAGFYGSASGLTLTKPIVGMASTPDGKGYWLVASDGGVFGYGDAHFYGSTGGIHLDAPVVGIAPTGDGKGYWLVASDGGVFAYGDAVFHGSLGGVDLSAAVVGIAPAHNGGYWLGRTAACSTSAEPHSWVRPPTCRWPRLSRA